LTTALQSVNEIIKEYEQMFSAKIKVKSIAIKMLEGCTKRKGLPAPSKYPTVIGVESIKGGE